MCTRRLGGGRILLDENTGVGAVVLRLRRFHYVAVWISYGHHCTYIIYIILEHMYTQFQLVLDLPWYN